MLDLASWLSNLRSTPVRILELIGSFSHPMCSLARILDFLAPRFVATVQAEV